MELNGKYIIDGYSQPGSAIPGPDLDGGTGVTPAVLPIQIKNAGSIAIGFQVNATGAGSTIQGLRITNFNDHGIVIYGTNTKISGCEIGLEAGGLAAGNGRSGITVSTGGVLIGGAGHWDRNVLAGNGVFFFPQADLYLDPASNGTKVHGNIVGLAAHGKSGYSGSGAQTGIYDAGNNNQIGFPLAGNVISNAMNTALWCNGCSGERVYGNIIGLDYNAMNAIPNSTGIFLGANGSNVMIGQPDSIHGNIISGNISVQIRVDEFNGVSIANNLIGPDKTGITSPVTTTFGVYMDNPNATNVVIGGFTPGERNVIARNQVGINLLQSGTGCMILNNYIGLTKAGDAASPNTNNGINIASAVLNAVQIGLPGAGNVISGQLLGGAGINITGGAAHAIVGNIIGLDPTGSFAIPNINGIMLNGANNVYIGGTYGTADRNVISGNSQWGIVLQLGGDFNAIRGNLIGTDVTGTIALGNTLGGILVGNTNNTQIGGTSADRNLVSGHNNPNSMGILLNSTGTGTVVTANFIGTDLNGTAPLGNYYGMMIDGSHLASVGGPVGAENYFASNQEAGVFLNSVAGPVVAGNIIGLGFAGAFPSSGNGYGILVQAPNAAIGTGFLSNIIANNTNHGILVDGDIADFVTIENNTIGTDFAGSAGIGNGGDGIVLSQADNASILNNVIIGNNAAGIRFTQGADNNIVRLNVIADLTSNTLTNNIGVQIVDGSQNNLVGGSHSTDANTIGNSVAYGVFVENSDSNFIMGNNIGNFGVATYPNPTGIYVLNSNATFIGDENGSGVNTGNIISGNTNNGIWLDVATNTTIRGNIIGLSETGAAIMPNTTGIVVASGSTATMIGGVGNPFHRNIISGNTQSGITLAAPLNTVSFNFIGTTLDGTGPAGVQDYGIIMDLQAINCTVGGDRDTEGNIISGNDVTGIIIYDESNMILGNTIGGSVTNNPIGTQVYGIELADPLTFNNQIGDDPSGGNDYGNVITNHSAAGIRIHNGATTNLISGNFIGITPSDAAFFTQAVGIRVEASAGTDNKIGNDVINGGNTISANGTGILLDGAVHTFIYNNRIGTNVSGSGISSNTTAGIHVFNGAFNTIGGAGLEGNVISGNGAYGIHIEGALATDNVVAGNIIGSNAGLSAVSPNNIGVQLSSGATGNSIGMAGNGLGNVIAGNDAAGVLITTADNNTVVNNRIGVLFPNNHGIVVQAGSVNNIIGGSATERNIISGNDSIGVALNASSGNQVIGNFIGTAASGDLPLPNLMGVFVSGGGPNTIGSPGFGNVISSNTAGGIYLLNTAFNIIQANLIGTDSTGNNTFVNSDNGTGIAILSSDDNVIGGNNANGEGNVVCNSTSSGVYFQDAQNNDLFGNSIGISKNGTTYLGNGNEGVLMRLGSDANNIGNSSTGMGNFIAANSKGIWLMHSDFNIIEANFIGNNTAGTTFVLAGSNNQQTGIHIDSTSSGNAIRELNVIGGNDQYGILISGAGTTANEVYGNHIGADVSGNIPLPNLNGVVIAAGASGNKIGLDIPVTGNIIGGNDLAQVTATGLGTDGNFIIANRIGIGADGITALGGTGGITCEDFAAGNQVGGAVSGQGNRIGFMAYNGIGFNGNSSGTIVHGNIIGLDFLGNPAPIAGHGIELNQSSGNIIGGVTPGAGNEITNCGAAGIAIGQTVSCSGNQVLANSIYNNAGQGIDLNGDDVVLPNDGLTFANTNNNEIDFPEIISAFDCSTTGTTKVGFITRVPPAASYTIEFFSNTTPDATNGEGQVFIDRITVVPANNPDTLSYDFGMVIPFGTSLTATLTGVSGTSEFGTNYVITNSPFTAAAVAGDETCLGSGDGTISVTATDAYHFYLDADPVQMGNQSYLFTGVSAGVHNVGIEYPNGCLVSSSQTINAGLPLTFMYDVVPDTCGQNLGSIVFSGTSGSPGPHTYSFSGGASFGIPADTLNVGAGNYDLVLADAVLGCLSLPETVAVGNITDVVDESFVFDDFCAGAVAVPTSVATAGGLFSFESIPGDGATIDGLTGEITSGVAGNSYSVIYTVGDCAEEDTILVSALTTDDPSFDIADFCEGGPQLTNITGLAGGTFSFDPDPGDGTVINPVTGDFAGLAGTTYFVKYVTNGSCPDSMIVPVAVLFSPAAPVILVTDSSYCPGDVYVPVSVALSGSETASWSLGDTANLVASTPDYIPASLVPGFNWIYVVVEESSGCLSAYDSVAYYLSDTAAMGVTADFSACIGSEAQLEAQGGSTYAWIPDPALSASDIADPVVTVMAGQTFVVTITNADGCPVTDSVMITLLPLSDCNVDTYNAFSPNSDGTNDFWLIDGIEGYPTNRVMIYSRWGDALRTFENYNNSTVVWDGTNAAGDLVPGGTFFYVVDVNGEQSQSGWVQVLR
jgi:gliding motility-associated-like protein